MAVMVVLQEKYAEEQTGSHGQEKIQHGSQKSK